MAETLRQKMPVSLELGIMALTFSLGVAFPVGIYSALRPDTKIDYFLRSIAIAFIVTPSFWLATMIMIYPSIWWNWSPRTAWVSFGEDALANLGMFIIPAIVLGMWYTGVTMRLIRTMMLEVLRQDYVRTAWAKGLREWVITLRHVLKNTLIPVVSLMGLQLPVLIGGSIVVEQIFGLPGMGLLIVEAINRRDYPIISGINLTLAGFVKESAYVEAARAIGCPMWRILWRHILPELVAPTIVIFSTSLGAAILMEATISFLGFGIPPPQPSWGGMLSLEGRQYMLQAPWLGLWPGVCVAVVVYGINMFGDAARDLLDPRLRGGAGRFGTSTVKEKSK